MRAFDSSVDLAAQGLYRLVLALPIWVPRFFCELLPDQGSENSAPC